jgi:hypothetical protein
LKTDRCRGKARRGKGRNDNRGNKKKEAGDPIKNINGTERSDYEAKYRLFSGF